MKQSKRKIRRTNIKKRTKKYNYRKIQRGGMLNSGDKALISDFMQRLSPDETVSIMFPYNNIHMDIAFPVKSLDQDINKNYDSFRKGVPTINLGTADLDFNDIFDVPNFITNDYDVIQLNLDIPEIVRRNIFDREQGILVPISEQPTGELIPNTVIYLIKTMKQLARESQGLTIYLDGVIQPKITHDAAAPTAAAANINTDTAPYKNTSAFYGTLLAKIKTNYNISRTNTKSPAITDKNWDIYFYKILNSFLADDPYLPYFDTFVRQISESIIPTNNFYDPMFGYRPSSRDNPDETADNEPLKPDWHIQHYDDKIQHFLKLPKITNPGDSNLLQYIKNKATIFIYTQNSKIIIQVYTIQYIVVSNIKAEGKSTFVSFFRGDKGRNKPYFQIVLGCIVMIKTVDIIKGTVEYDYEIRWLLNQHTINNIEKSGINLQPFFANNVQDILLEEDSTYGLSKPKNTHNYNDPTLPGNRISSPSLREQKQTFNDILTDGFSPQPKQSFTDPGSGVQLAPLSSIKSSSSAAGVEDLSKQYTAESTNTEPGGGVAQGVAQGEVGGRKKNKTRKRSKKGKTKY
jgi:hypothetical protein